MDEDLKSRDKTLERLKVDNEIEGERLSIVQKKALEREAKQKYGRDWKKILGVMKSVRPDMDTVHDLYGIGLGDLKEAGKPPGMRRER